MSLFVRRIKVSELRLTFSGGLRTPTVIRGNIHFHSSHWLHWEMIDQSTCTPLVRNDIVLLLGEALSAETTQAVTLASLWIYGSGVPTSKPSLFFCFWLLAISQSWFVAGSPLVLCGVRSYFTFWILEQRLNFEGTLTSPSGCTRWGRPGWGATPQRSSPAGWATAGLGGRPRRPSLSSSLRPWGEAERHRAFKRLQWCRHESQIQGRMLLWNNNVQPTLRYTPRRVRRKHAQWITANHFTTVHSAKK